MPALIDYRACDDSPYCSAARLCPSRAMKLTDGKWVVDTKACGNCSGVCTNVCPAGAIRYAPTLAGLEKIRLEIENSAETADDIFEKRYGVRPGDPHELGDNLFHASCDGFGDDVLQSDLPVVVDFWAEWCAPCKLIAPIFKKLAAEYEGRIKFYKLDTEECGAIAARFGINSIPSLLFFRGGKVVAHEIGAVPEARLRQSIDAVLASGPPAN